MTQPSIRNQTITFLKICLLALIVSSCSQNQNYNRGYVISHTEVERDAESAPSTETLDP